MSSPIARNSLWNAGGFLFGLAILLATTPIYIRLLGLDQFGIFTLLVSLTVPLSVLNAGMAQATTKYVAEFLAAGSLANAARMLETTLLFNAAVGCLGSVGLWWVGPWAAQEVFKIKPEILPEAMAAFQLTGLVWLSSQVLGTYQAVIIGFQDFRALTLGQCWQQFATYGLGVGVLWFRPQVSALMLWNVFVGCIFTVYWFYQSKKRLPMVRAVPRWDKSSARLCLGFSYWQMIDTLTSLAANHLDRLLLGSFISASSVGLYGIAANVQSRTVGLVWSVLRALFPAASSLSTAPQESERLILNYGWKISMVGAGLYAVVFVLGPDFLQFWLGPEVGSQAAPVLRVLMAAALLGL
ncbi:MAG: oligosaccharide flippase family protein, partial [Chloroflexi bacterium]|nr:oligosaccharide flippase family protein [Chloroflexota bacterium]